MTRASSLPAAVGPGEGGPARALRRGGEERGSRPSSAARPSFLSGWRELDELLWTRELSFSLGFPPHIDPAPFSLGSRPKGAFGPGQRPEAAPLARESLRFFDFETSGLSGGTGTVAFLAAVGRFEGSDFLVTQLFLEDYPGEGAYLEALLASLGAPAKPGGAMNGTAVFTYNGKSFDLPLLRSRCVMNGLPIPALRDYDALRCARRLWARIYGGASLGLLEREVLGLERGEDVPGSDIPGIWFEYLRRGDHPLMGAVMAHNASDVSTLAALVSRIDQSFERPGKLAASASIDRGGLGRDLLRLGRCAEGEGLLEAAAGEGDEAAGLLLSRRYRRLGRVEERRAILELLPRSRRSCVERAKFYEHSSRELGAALAWAREAAGLSVSEDERVADEARVARLQRKLARA